MPFPVITAVMYQFQVNELFLTRTAGETKVNMSNMYREKCGLTHKSLVLQGQLLLSNIETDRLSGKKKGV